MAKYVPTVVPTSGDIGQLQRWLRIEFERVRDAVNAIYDTAGGGAVVTAGYGGVGVLDRFLMPPAPADGWRTVQMDEVFMQNPRAVHYVDKNIALELPGVWMFIANVTLYFVDAPPVGGTAQLRLVNLDTGEALPTSMVQVSVPRVEKILLLGNAVPVEIEPADVGERLAIQVRLDPDNGGEIDCLAAHLHVTHMAGSPDFLTGAVRARRL